ncbi:rhomboid family intramembrane serine protease [Ereboglobus luteus]|uniref:Peptidase S54 rhomboid domain-containing protein n=1 Tax=Ereboglobus luteus TaxID=1796921 RepID=A0A2U8E238_9BACT|nr:rhomboid family intramembrane serine protease [Ereboglobus luteus]AWI08901.1 hypothetical protein CKA38_06225 [Ereboglobus luteus]
MRALVVKLRHIYLPFFVIAQGFISIYTFLDWLLFIKLDILPVHEEVLTFWLPCFFPFLPVWYWLVPRIKLLKLSENAVFAYWGAAVIAISTPTIVAQNWLYKSAGELIELESIHEISTVEKTKFYILKKIHIGRADIGRHTVFDTGGKNNERFTMHLYFVFPILEDPASALRRETSPAWLGIEYSKAIDNRWSNVKKDEAYRAFAKDCHEKILARNLAQFEYLERPGYTPAADGFQNALKKSPRFKGKNNIVLIPRETPFIERGASSFRWIFYSFSIGSGIWFIMLLFPKMGKDAMTQIRYRSYTKDRDSFLRNAVSVVRPSKNYPATLIILYINILLFAAMVACGLGFLSFNACDLLAWGANFRPLVAEGEGWRLLTSMFLHGGFIHLFGNMYGLIFIGLFLGPMLGGARFWIAYLLSGILAGCASNWWNEDIVSVGASGAIFGMYGLFLALRLTKTVVHELGTAVLVSIFVFVGLNLLFGFTRSGIDNAGHIAGLLVGFAIGLIYCPLLRREGAKIDSEEKPSG